MASREPAVRHFWSTKEAAEYLGVTPWTLCCYIRGKGTGRGVPKLTGGLPPYKRLSRNVIRYPIEPFKNWAHTYNIPEGK